MFISTFHQRSVKDASFITCVPIRIDGVDDDKNAKHNKAKILNKYQYSVNSTTSCAYSLSYSEVVRPSSRIAAMHNVFLRGQNLRSRSASAEDS